MHRWIDPFVDSALETKHTPTSLADLLQQPLPVVFPGSLITLPAYSTTLHDFLAHLSSRAVSDCQVQRLGDPGVTSLQSFSAAMKFVLKSNRPASVVNLHLQDLPSAVPQGPCTVFSDVLLSVGNYCADLHVEELGLTSYGYLCEFKDATPCVKYWFIYTKVTKGLKWKRSVEGQSTTEKVRAYLRSCDYVVKQRPGQTVYIPAGHYHAVLTQFGTSALELPKMAVLVGAIAFYPSTESLKMALSVCDHYPDGERRGIKADQVDKLGQWMGLGNVSKDKLYEIVGRNTQKRKPVGVRRKQNAQRAREGKRKKEE